MTIKTYQWCGLSAFAVLFLFLQPANTAEKKRATNWCFVGQQLVSPLPESEDSWIPDDSYRANWKTIIADSKSNKTVAAPYIVLSNHLNKVEIKTVKRKAPVSVRLGKGKREARSVTMQVDQLYLRSLSGNQMTLIAGAQELAENKKDFAHAVRNPWYEATFGSFECVINLLAVGNNTVSFEVRSNAPGGNHPSHYASWRTVSVDARGVRALKHGQIPVSTVKAALERIEPETKERIIEDLDSFAILPSKTSSVFQWAFSFHEQAARGDLFVVSSANNPGAMPETISSPDGTVTITCSKGILYWKDNGSKAAPRPFAKGASLRGWQWLDEGKLSAEEKAFLRAQH